MLKEIIFSYGSQSVENEKNFNVMAAIVNSTLGFL